MSESPRLWSVALVGSVLAHVGMVLALGLIPEGEPRRAGAARRDELFTPGAVVPIETTTTRVALRPIPSERPALPAAEPPPNEPAMAPIDQPLSSRPAPSGVDPVEPTEAEAEPTDRPGLSLAGLRDQSLGATHTGKVVVAPGQLAGSRQAYEKSVGEPGIGEGGVQGPAAPSSGGSKDLAFEREGDKLIYRDPGGRFTATLRSDGRVDFKNKAGKMSWTDNAIGDPSTILMKAAGEDPYATAKAKLLKATFDLRLGMAVAFQKKQLDKRLTRLEGELDKIWTDTSRELLDRKELLFQRWDECDEPEELPEGATHEVPGFGGVQSSELDEARHDTATAARDKIESFIRKHAAKGTPEAFSAAELADMNKRRISKQKFAPYD